MARLLSVLVLGCLPVLSSAFLPVRPHWPAHATHRVRSGVRMEVPVDLEGVLDPSRVWDVKVTLNGETKVLSISEGTSLLEAAEEAFPDPPCLCRNGVCTTCAALVTAGIDPPSFKQAIESLSPEQSANHFILTCQTYPTGPGLEVTLNMQDRVYEDQYAKHEKAAAQEIKQKKGFNIFA